MVKENNRLTERDYLLGLSLFAGIGFKTYQKIVEAFGSLAGFWQAGQKELIENKLPYAVAIRFLLFRQQVDITAYKLSLAKKLVRFLTVIDKDYPFLLKEINSPPLVLYYRGSMLVNDAKALAVVGSRKPTTYGREMTEHFTTELVVNGFTVVSGLARGVDSIAHRVALRKGGRTLAVLGSGLDCIYPPEHRSLAEEISRHGALISEYPPGQKPHPTQFPARNRIISGLSLGILITEGASKSGTKTTAAFAADQSREVFCVPGPVNSPLSAGPAELIKTGAKLTTGITDILEELQVEPGGLKPAGKAINFDSLEQEKIWQILSFGQKSADQLVKSLGYSVQQTMSVLTVLELKGLVKNVGDGKFMVT